MIQLSEIVVIPLAKAFLCPQHEAVVNTQRCPLCDSQTIVLSRIVGQQAKEIESEQTAA